MSNEYSPSFKSESLTAAIRCAGLLERDGTRRSPPELTVVPNTCRHSMRRRRRRKRRRKGGEEEEEGGRGRKRKRGGGAVDLHV